MLFYYLLPPRSCSTYLRAPGAALVFGGRLGTGAWARVGPGAKHVQFASCTVDEYTPSIGPCLKDTTVTTNSPRSSSTFLRMVNAGWTEWGRARVVRPAVRPGTRQGCQQSRLSDCGWRKRAAVLVCAPAGPRAPLPSSSAGSEPENFRSAAAHHPSSAVRGRCAPVPAPYAAESIQRSTLPCNCSSTAAICCELDS